MYFVKPILGMYNYIVVISSTLLDLQNQLMGFQNPSLGNRKSITMIG